MRLFKQQASAYYDPKSNTIRELEGGLSIPGAKRLIYSHELVHAYQDQKYNLGSTMEKIQANGNFDRKTAFKFVIEGHANLVSMASRLGAESMSEDFFQNRTNAQIFSLMSKFTEISPEQIQMIMNFLPKKSRNNPMIKNLQNLQQIPWILVQQMIDPYFYGQNVWFNKGRKKSWQNAERWLTNPPNSTREFLYKIDSTKTNTPSTLEHMNPDYSTSLGLYMLLRWLEKFPKLPQWGQHHVNDRVSVLARNDDTNLVWEHWFANSTAREQFMSDLEVITDPPHSSTSHSTLDSRILDGPTGIRQLWIHETDTHVQLIFDDDPDPNGVIETVIHSE